MLSKSDTNITIAISLLNDFFVEAGYLVPTDVGLEKSIMDATLAFRSYLKNNSIHDYDGQKQGPDGKVVINAFFVMQDQLIPTTASLYRPYAKGKGGDPRIWFSKLGKYAKANNLLSVIAYEHCLYVINMSDSNIRSSSSSPDSPLGSLLRKFQITNNSIAEELLAKLQEISSLGWIKSMRHGDTGVGATLEKCLGIEANSRKDPDYKGIEIKAKRINNLKVTTRTTLFTQVPDWTQSQIKSSAALLDRFGYLRGDIRKLNCTVRSQKTNSQGLMLIVDESSDLLREVYKHDELIEDLVCWQFNKLRSCLLAKHSETFWVGAKSKTEFGFEYFKFDKVIHTRLPFVNNFHTLCHEGVISLDHMIKRSSSGRVSERGPSFKIKQSNLGLLFPKPVTYYLS
jgi:hypothetical protein